MQAYSYRVRNCNTLKEWFTLYTYSELAVKCTHVVCSDIAQHGFGKQFQLQKPELRVLVAVGWRGRLLLGYGVWVCFGVFSPPPEIDDNANIFVT